MIKIAILALLLCSSALAQADIDPVIEEEQEQPVLEQPKLEEQAVPAPTPQPKF